MFWLFQIKIQLQRVLAMTWSPCLFCIVSSLQLLAIGWKIIASFFSFSLNHIWNKNKQISLHSDELDLILADSGLGDGSQILAFESEPVESSETSHARVLDAGGVEIQGHWRTQSKKILCSGLPGRWAHFNMPTHAWKENRRSSNSFTNLSPGHEKSKTMDDTS